jgi:hypothetical protein
MGRLNGFCCAEPASSSFYGIEIRGQSASRFRFQLIGGSGARYPGSEVQGSSFDEAPGGFVSFILPGHVFKPEIHASAVFAGLKGCLLSRYRRSHRAPQQEIGLVESALIIKDFRGIRTCIRN